MMNSVHPVAVNNNVNMDPKGEDGKPQPAPETGQSNKKRGICAAIKDELTPNMTFLPLKLTWFFFSSSTFAFMPYLTIHMKVK